MNYKPFQSNTEPQIGQRVQTGRDSEHGVLTAVDLGRVGNKVCFLSDANKAAGHWGRELYYYCLGPEVEPSQEYKDEAASHDLPPTLT